MSNEKNPQPFDPKRLDGDYGRRLAPPPKDPGGVRQAPALFGKTEAATPPSDSCGRGEVPPSAAEVGRDDTPAPTTSAVTVEQRKPSLKNILITLGVVGALLLKFKSLAFAILKFFPLMLKTGGTMFLSIGLYAIYWGWKFAAGFVLLMLVHECGHLLAAKRIGLKVGAPVFIPFMGAFIALKEAPKDAWIEAQVGIGGPLLGSLGAFVCLLLYAPTRDPLYIALAYSGFFLNLFNLIPIGMLDGGRVVAAISPFLWLVGAVITGVMLVYTGFNIILLLILVFCLPSVLLLFREKTDEERRYYTVSLPKRLLISFLYFGLAGMLAIATMLTHRRPPPPRGTVGQPRQSEMTRLCENGAANQKPVFSHRLAQADIGM